MATINKGDVVTINSGAKWYKGQSIPSWVMALSWIVSSVSGDRAVLDKSPDNSSYSICSPISTSYLTVKSSSSSGSSSSSTTSNVISNVQLYSEGSRTLLASWSWSRDNTDHYMVRWWYYTKNQVPTLGEEKDVSTSSTTCRYTMPSDALKVWFHVKPVSTTHKVNDTDTYYWTAEWSTAVCWWESGDTPNTPSVPTVTVEDYLLKASVDNFDLDQGIYQNYIEFQIVKNNNTLFADTKIEAKYTHASIQRTIEPGSTYKVRCRLVQYPGSLTNQSWSVRESEWSSFSNEVSTKPSMLTKGFTTCKAASKTSVYLAWDKITTATSYDIQYATKDALSITDDTRDFGKAFNSSDGVQTINDIKDTTSRTVTGLETGNTYYFRIRAVNDNGESDWSAPRSVTIGTKPKAPTTWSSTTTAIVGETVTLYWVHNSVDNSSQTYGQIEITVNDGTPTYHTVENTTDEEERDKTSTYTLNTSTYSAGAEIKWRVKTAGITREFGDWSASRTIEVYSRPVVDLRLLSTPTSGVITRVTSFPFYASGVMTAMTLQNVIGYHLSVVANESYETVDNLGNSVNITSGDEVYSKYFDISTTLLVEFSPSNIDLVNNVSYTATCIVTMDSGLTAEDSCSFTVGWTESVQQPNAEIGIDPQTLVAYIRPYCEYQYGVPVEDIYLSVYRREFDGGFTEIATKVDNTRIVDEDVVVGNNIYVTDPHPALDYARYRIIATSKTTGAINYFDTPSYPVGEKAVIIQWNEDWTEFESVSGDSLVQQPWSGSLLRLPYNIDVSDSYGQDVSLVKYIGRKRPVSYYGTQLGESSSWSVAIAKSDTDTLYALRRLATWTGDVYVREPSGSGYWANISVSFGQKHTEVTIPVTLNITRVEGGM